jgi:hypothetical protein
MLYTITHMNILLFYIILYPNDFNSNEPPDLSNPPPTPKLVDRDKLGVPWGWEVRQTEVNICRVCMRLGHCLT